MSRKTIILSAIVAIIALAGSLVIFYFQSFKTVHFDVKKEGVTVKVVSNQKKSEVQTFTNSTDLQLQDGKYTALLESDRYNNVEVVFEVSGKDITVTIDPSLSKARLAEMLTNEKAATHKKITDSYPKTIKGFVVKDGELYKDGEWYATTLVQKTASLAYEPDVYRTVLKKENGQWVIKAKPELVLSAKKYPDIPFDILSSVNRRDKNQP